MRKLTKRATRSTSNHQNLPGATAYMGAVGDDEFAKIMKEQASADGVDVR